MRPGAPATAFAALLRRDLLVFWRHRSDALNPLVFALIVVTMFPLALGPDASKLAPIAGGVTWVTVVLASLLSLDALFRSDAEDGSLDLLVASGQPLALLAAARLLAHWLGTGLPLTLAGPVLAALLGLQAAAVATLAVALALGTPLLSLLGGACAALTVGLRRSGILLSLLVLPLTLPVLIFGAGAVEAAVSGATVQVPLLFLAAGLVLALPLAPLACAAAIRLNVS
ncbi:MAG TPA: heme exporter protein CcmB [Candidatus Saccharimonadia bacterium]|nr:heme exporter protein CcmB [Candidatus Saccharimonadia bacterium]